MHFFSCNYHRSQTLSLDSKMCLRQSFHVATDVLQHTCPAEQAGNTPTEWQWDCSRSPQWQLYWESLWLALEKNANSSSKNRTIPLAFLSDPILLQSMAPLSCSSHTSVVGSICSTWLCHGTFRCIGWITARGDGASFKAPVTATLDYGLPQILPCHSSATIPGYGICLFCSHAW